MAHGQWGNCKACRHFASHNAQPSDDETSQCTQPELREFELEVSGNSGCNAYEARAGLGSSQYQEPAPSSLH